MKKVATIEILVDENLQDAKECVNEVYNHMINHEFIDDGSVMIKVIEINENI